jgi:hypothetical protein
MTDCVTGKLHAQISVARRSCRAMNRGAGLAAGSFATALMESVQGSAPVGRAR